MREKLNIRLPTDEGPNPYDSKTMPNDLPKNAWLTSWGWWVSIVLLAGGAMLVRYFNGTL